MKELFISDKRTRKKSVCAITLNVLALLLSVILFKPYLGASTDEVMASLLYGFSGEYEIHLIFSNIFLGKVLVKLMCIWSWVPWFAVMQYALLFVSFCVMTVIILEKFPLKHGILLSGLVLTFFGEECYVNVEYMKTATVLVCTGMLLITFLLLENEKKKRYYVLADALILAGSMLCYSMYVKIFVFMLLIMLYAVLRGKSAEKRKKLTVMCVSLLLVFGGAMLLEAADAKYYENNEKWADFQERRVAVEKLTVYGWPDYQENITFFEDAGVSETEYSLWKNGIITDKNVLTSDMYNKISNLWKNNAMSISNVLDFSRKIPSLFLSVPAFILFLLLCYIMCVSGDKKVKRDLFLLLGVVLLSNFVLYSMQELNNPLIRVCLWTMAVFGVLCLMHKNENQSNIKYENLFLYICVTLLISGRFFITDIQTEIGRSADSYTEITGMTGLISDHSQSTFMIKSEEMTSHISAFSFPSWEWKGLNNIYVMETTFSDVLGFEQKDLAFFYNEVMNGVNVYLVSSEKGSNITVLQKYYKEHFNSSLMFEKVNSANGMSVYGLKLVEEQPVVQESIDETEDGTLME